jgi:hypothetical protein
MKIRYGASGKEMPGLRDKKKIFCAGWIVLLTPIIPDYLMKEKNLIP